MLSLTPTELRGVLAHELLHAILQHPARRKTRTPWLWNIACDHAVNKMLLDFGFALPEGALIAPRECDGMNAEAIYDFLMRQRMKPAQDNSAATPENAAVGRKNDAEKPGPLITSPDGQWTLSTDHRPEAMSRNTEDPPARMPAKGFQDLLDPSVAPASLFRQPSDPDAPTMQKIAEQLRNDLFTQAKQAGVLPGDCNEELCASGRAEVDWRALMQSFLTETLKTDWRLFPPSKRFISQGLYLPSCGAPGLGRIAFAIDTSGSVYSSDIARILSEIQSFRESFPCRLTVLQADAEIASVTEFDAWESPEEDYAWKITGRGGTNFRPVFEWVRKEIDQGDAPAVLVYATDGYGPFPEEAGIPVIWLVTPGGAPESYFPPWGAYVPLSPES